MRKVRLACALMVAMAAPSWAAATWNIVTNASCTGQRTATIASQASSSVDCCNGSGQGFCNRRMNFGDLFEYMVTMVGTGTYTTNGDLVSSAELAKLGMRGAIVFAECDQATDNTATPAAVFFPSLQRLSNSSLRLELFLTQNTQVGNGTSMAGVTVRCMVWGY